MSAFDAVKSCEEAGKITQECMAGSVEGVGMEFVNLLVSVTALLSILILLALVLASVVVGAYGILRTGLLIARTGIRIVTDHRRASVYARECATDVYWISTWAVSTSAVLYVLFTVLGFILVVILTGIIRLFNVGDAEMRREVYTGLIDQLTYYNPIALLQADAPNPGSVAFWLCVVAIAVFGGLHRYGLERDLEKPPSIREIVTRGETSE